MAMMTCDGYEALVDYDPDAELFHGEVSGLKDVVTFQGRSVDDLKRSFADSLADYFEFCRTRGEQPEKPYSGQFMIRVEPALHRALAAAARREGLSLNKFVSCALASTVSTKGNRKPRPRDFAGTAVL